MSDLRTIAYTDIDEIEKAISNKESFKVGGYGEKFLIPVKKVETIIESKGLRCRVYTQGRKATLAAIPAMIVPTGITQVLGLASAAAGIGYAIHNMATYDPDYEIIKMPFDVNNFFIVEYKKSSSS